MPDILLATLNAKFIHASFGLRYLLANLGELQPRAALMEFDVNQRPIDVAEALLAQSPRILGLGVYVWNVQPTTELVAILKQARPDLVIILGGPEVSFEWEQQEVVRLADHVITGEADLKFAEVCRRLLDPGASVGDPLPKGIPAGLPDLARVALPYDLYDDRDIAHRVVYVEASRGCPFTCEFCLSSLDVPVRAVPLEPFLAALQCLLDRGVRQFKFVDRTFNLNLSTSRAILEFFLGRWRPGLFVHFEMVPDRLPEPLREVIARFPPGALQFEVGIQTFDPEVGARIRRRQDIGRLEENLRWLRSGSGVHVHADLIVGLPGESLEGFGAGFDRLLALRPQEIQVGMLKRLRGTPIGRHDAAWGMAYNPMPPYEILQNRQLDFATLGRLRRFARFWDIFGNSGNFQESLPLVWTRAGAASEGESPAGHPGTSPFWSLLEWSDWLHGRGVKTSGVALVRQYELLWEYLSGRHPAEVVVPCMTRDYRRSGRRDLPRWLEGPDIARPPADAPRAATGGLPRRQARHLGTGGGA